MFVNFPKLLMVLHYLRPRQVQGDRYVVSRLGNRAAKRSRLDRMLAGTKVQGGPTVGTPQAGTGSVLVP